MDISSNLLIGLQPAASLLIIVMAVTVVVLLMLIWRAESEGSEAGMARD